MAFALNLRKPLAGRARTRRRGERRPADDAGGDDGRRPGLRPAGVGVAAGADAQRRSAGARTPGKVPLIGHLPIARQFHVLGILLVTFLVFAALIMSLDVRTAAQAAASTATATEMQMLSQRLSSSSTLALQGRPVAFEAVKDTRERFKADLDALQRGGTVKGVDARRRAGRLGPHAAAGHQGAMGPRRSQRRAAARKPAAPDRRREGLGHRRAGQQAARRALAARRQRRARARAMSSTRTSSRC